MRLGVAGEIRQPPQASTAPRSTARARRSEKATLRFWAAAHITGDEKGGARIEKGSGGITEAVTG